MNTFTLQVASDTIEAVFAERHRTARVVGGRVVVTFVVQTRRPPGDLGAIAAQIRRRLGVSQCQIRHQDGVLVVIVG